ncbi:MAG TPA: DUF4870 domain-containing protein [Galbitalea sp.]|jgi:uncharacterized Tic20 family protein
MLVWPSLIGYLIAKDRGGFIRDHTRTALNFQLTALIGYVAAMASGEGRLYNYPIAIEFIKP